MQIKLSVFRASFARYADFDFGVDGVGRTDTALIHAGPCADIPERVYDQVFPAIVWGGNDCAVADPKSHPLLYEVIIEPLDRNLRVMAHSRHWPAGGNQSL